MDFKPKFVSKKERERRKQAEQQNLKDEKEKQEKLLHKKNKLYARGLTGEQLYK